MPIFEYKCAKCDTLFEKLVSAGSDTAYACPKCGSSETKKQLSSFAGIVSSVNKSCPAKSACESAGHTCGSCCPMHRHQKVNN